MKTTAEFLRKSSKHDLNPIRIDKIVTLPDREFQGFAQNLLRDYDFIAENIDIMGTDNDGTTHCLLVISETEPDGYAVDSQGYNYPHYTAYFPNAREFINANIKRLADYAVFEGSHNTVDGKWNISYDELAEHFDTSVTPDNGIGELLLKELQERNEVAECIMTEDSIEMIYHLEHCPQCKKGGIGGFLSLVSLMGCNLEDVHLCDSEEDHDLATIVELSENTLTYEGKRDWNDVLSAKVERIYTGYYGLQIGLSGCKPGRLRDFSFMLAGQCSAEDYDRWVNSAPEQEQDIKMR